MLDGLKNQIALHGSIDHTVGGFVVGRASEEPLDYLILWFDFCFLSICFCAEDISSSLEENKTRGVAADLSSGLPIEVLPNIETLQGQSAGNCRKYHILSVQEAQAKSLHSEVLKEVFCDVFQRRFDRTGQVVCMQVAVKYEGPRTADKMAEWAKVPWKENLMSAGRS